VGAEGRQRLAAPQLRFRVRRVQRRAAGAGALRPLLQEREAFVCVCQRAGMVPERKARRRAVGVADVQLRVRHARGGGALEGAREGRDGGGVVAAPRLVHCGLRGEAQV
jgi:hypothetical protein